jgi:hypothetical protein
MAKRSDIPAHLGRHGREFYAAQVADYKITRPARLELLTRAAEALDRLRQAQEAIAKDGLMADGKIHPAAKVEKEARDGFLAAMRMLKLWEERKPLRRARSALHGIRSRSSTKSIYWEAGDDFLGWPERELHGARG